MKTDEQIFPNYLRIKFSPFEGIDATIEFFVPSSRQLKGRIQVTNSRLTTRTIKVQLAAVLTPNEDGYRMAHDDVEAVTILKGKSGNIFPVLFMTGGPKASTGPYPALSVNLEMVPGAIRELVWVQASEEDPIESFELARSAASLTWEYEIAKIEIMNQRLMEIKTGDEDWNAAFALAQKSAISHLIGPTKSLPYPSCVGSRLPDKGYSAIGDGSDYDHLWNGQTPLEVFHLSNILLPSYPGIVKGLFLNFLSIQTQNGYIDLKPGLAGQRRNLLATPILINLAWRIFQIENDTSFLEKVFPQLFTFTMSWFDDRQDKDGDGLPEWDRPIQSGFENHPVFTQGNAESQGGDISKIESPSLCSFLFEEIRLLIKMARKTQNSGPLSSLEAIADNLRSGVETAWNGTKSIYQNWDMESHFSPQGERLGHFYGPNIYQVNREFNFPKRLSFQITANSETPGGIQIFIHGIGSSGNFRIERISSDRIRWYLQDGYCSSEQIFSSIENIEVTGVKSDDLIVIDVMDFSFLDQTLLLPLWAKIPDKDRAREMVIKTIRVSGLFWKEFGISACIPSSLPENNNCNRIYMVWNHFIGKGLLNYGFRVEAAELVSNLMKAFVKNLKNNKSYYDSYCAGTGVGYGERNSLNGLISIRLFLDTLGVQVLSPNKVIISGENPYPWPVTIRFQGLTVFREIHRTKITFPGGQSAIVKNNGARVISLEEPQ